MLNLFLTSIFTLVKTVLTDIPRFNELEDIRRKIRINAKISCKEFAKNKKHDNFKIKAQQKAYLKDEDKVKHHMRSIKNKFKKDIKMIKSGTTTL
mgnify:CR=1 FL=1